MRVLLFDTETNGLPKAWRAPPHQIDNWPRILSIAWKMYEMNSAGVATELERGYTLVKPEASTIWDADSAKIHGISREKAEAEGATAESVFTGFMNLARGAHLIVAHNIQFDKNVVLAELLRLNPRLVLNWWPRLEYCTCEGTTRIVKLPAAKPRPSDPYKRPKLAELYKFLFEVDGTFDYHTAAGDTECLSQCFIALVRRRLIPFELWERSLRV